MRTIKILSTTFIVLLCATFISCGGDEELNGLDENVLVEKLKGKKWIYENIEADASGDYAWLDEESCTLYFLSESIGIERAIKRTSWSDGSKDKDTQWNYFNYKISGNEIQISFDGGGSEIYVYKNDCLVNKNDVITYYNAFELNSDDYENIEKFKPMNGTCGNNLTWTFHKTFLSIEGNGDMFDYEDGTQPWKDCLICYVSTGEGVTSIGNHAFDQINSIEQLDFSSTLQRIGDEAFSQTSIKQVEIPKNVREIGKKAFYQCSSLSKVSIAEDNSLIRIGDYAFSDCSEPKFDNLTFNENFESFGEFCFSGCSITKLNFNGNKCIEENTFWECTINTLSINEVKIIEPRTFLGCKINSLTLGEGLEEIKEYAFMGSYINDKKLELPKSLKSIGEYAIEGAFNSITIGSEVSYIGTSAFMSSVSSGSMYIHQGTPLNVDETIITKNGGGYREKYWTLYVPKGCKEVYSKKYPWNQFKSIYEDDTLEGAIEESGNEENTEDNDEEENGSTNEEDNNGNNENNENNGTIDYTSLTYSIKSKTYKMIRVDGGNLDPFYIMQTELPISSQFKIGDTNFGALDINGDGVIIKYELREFVNALREETGLNFRLPTPKEWQFAAQGGSKSSNYTYSGSNDIDDVAWYKGNSNNSGHDIATKKPNELGLYDMSGNYGEVCSDDEFDVDGNIYGGSWQDAASDCKITSYKKGTKSSNNIPGTKIKELNAFDATATTVRLVYSAPE